MMENKPTDTERGVRMYAVLFTLIAAIAGVALIYLLMIRSEADTSAQSSTVQNANPTVDSVITAVASGGADQANVSLIENGVKRIFIRGVASDNNGCNDIDTAGNWAFRVYRTPQGSACTPDNNDCYAGNTANLTFTNCTGVGDLNLDYEGYVDVQFYADATDAGSNFSAENWTAWVKAVDEATGNATQTDTFEVNSLMALDVTANINYGTLALGADSGVQTVAVTQTGNRSFDVNRSVDGDMICDGQGSQNINVGQLKRHLTDNAFAWTDAGAAALSTTPTEDELNVGRRTNDGSPLIVNYYLRLRMPTSGLRGTCNNVLTLAAVTEENP